MSYGYPTGIMAEQRYSPYGGGKDSGYGKGGGKDGGYKGGKEGGYKGYKGGKDGGYKGGKDSGFGGYKGGKGHDGGYDSYGGGYKGGKGEGKGFGKKGGFKGGESSMNPEDRGVEHGDPRYQWTDPNLFNPFDKVEHPLYGSQDGQTVGEANANVHVKNLPTHADRLWLYSLFAPFGAINAIRCQRDVTSGKCVGWGLVKYHFQADAATAIQSVNNYKIDGRTISVEYSNR